MTAVEEVKQLPIADPEGEVVELLTRELNSGRAVKTTVEQTVSTTRVGGLSVKDCFPYPGLPDTTCSVCNVAWKDHTYLDFFLKEVHQAKIRDWFDHKYHVIGQIEALIIKLDRSGAGSAYLEKERIDKILGVLETQGAKNAMIAQRLMDYHAGSTRSLNEVWMGGKNPIFDWRRLYDVYVREFRLVREQLVMIYKDEGKVDGMFPKMYGRVASAKYLFIRESVEQLESIIEGELHKFEVMSENSLEEKIDRLAVAMTVEKNDFSKSSSSFAGAPVPGVPAKEKVS